LLDHVGSSVPVPGVNLVLRRQCPAGRPDFPSARGEGLRAKNYSCG